MEVAIIAGIPDGIVFITIMMEMDMPITITTFIVKAVVLLRMLLYIPLVIDIVLLVVQRMIIITVLLARIMGELAHINGSIGMILHIPDATLGVQADVLSKMIMHIKVNIFHPQPPTLVNGALSFVQAVKTMSYAIHALILLI